MRTASKLILFATAVSALILGACSKKSKNDDGSSNEGGPSVNENPANTLGVTGQLVLNLGLTESSSKGVLVFTLDYKGNVVSKTEVDVASDGSFSANIERNQTDKLEKVVVDGQVNRDLLKSIFPNYANDIDKMSDDQIKQEIGGVIEEAKNNPSLRYVMVSYDKTGDKELEAKSMQFIGLPTPGASLKLLPGDSLKGDINFGQIRGEGDEAVSTLTAEESVNLPASVIQELAGASQTLKILKNNWMNPETKADVTPWFGYAVTDLSQHVNKFNTLTKSSLTFGGGGYYIRPEDIGASWGEVCPANPSNSSDTSGTPYSATPSKSLNWYPPVDIASTEASGVTFGPNHPYTNVSTQYHRESQYGEISCMKSVTGGTDTGMYTRGKTESDKSFQMQLGEYLYGQAPEGLWRLKVDGTEVGRWDLASAVPYDKDNDPVIYIPAIKAIVDGSGVATAFEAKFYFYDKGTNAFREVTDVTGLQSLVHDFGIDGQYGLTHSGGDLHVNANNGTVGADGVVHLPLAQADQAAFPCPSGTIMTQCIRKVGFSYFIGSISYRMSLDSNGGL